MFYILSKTLGLLADPVVMLILLIATVVITALVGWRRVSLALGVATVLIGALFGLTNLGSILLAPLESQFSRPDNPPGQVDGIIVLGGSVVGKAPGQYEFNAAADRVFEAVRLARLHPDATIVLSGGIGALGGTGESEADATSAVFTAVGLQPANLILERNSRNTHENAVGTKAALGDLYRAGQTWLLVTSAVHMPRAVAVFRKAGLDVVPWPVDYRGNGRPFSINLGSPIENADNVAAALNEWIGQVAYRVAGYI